MKELKIKAALISVFDKTGLEPIIKTLHEQEVTLYSTGGTQQFIEDLGVPVVAVEDLTGYPSILGGRVKTLHPKVFGGILNRQGNPSDEKEIATFEIPQIDLVIVDLYPFEETVASSASEDEIIEKIDIGGIALIRAAAKNFKDVLCVSNKKYYAELFSCCACIFFSNTRSFTGTTTQVIKLGAANCTTAHYFDRLNFW